MGDDRTWVAAAGWLVHGRAAIGDGRQCASDTLAEIARRGRGLLDDPGGRPAAQRDRGPCGRAVRARSGAVARRTGPVRGPVGRRPADADGVLVRCLWRSDRPPSAKQRGVPSSRGVKWAGWRPTSRARPWPCSPPRPYADPGGRTRPSITLRGAWPASTGSGRRRRARRHDTSPPPLPLNGSLRWSRPAEPTTPARRAHPWPDNCAQQRDRHGRSRCCGRRGADP